MREVGRESECDGQTSYHHNNCIVGVYNTTDSLSRTQLLMRKNRYSSSSLPLLFLFSSFFITLFLTYYYGKQQKWSRNYKSLTIFLSAPSHSLFLSLSHSLFLHLSSRILGSSLILLFRTPLSSTFPLSSLLTPLFSSLFSLSLSHSPIRHTPNTAL